MKRKSAYLQITRKCNNECIFCSNPQFDKEYSLEEAKKRVLEFKNDSITEILITGGEPTSIDFLAELIKFITEQGINPRIITNGVFLSDKIFAENLYSSGLKGINISIHTSDENIAERLSQRKGHLKKTLQGIKNAIMAGMDVQLNTTINSLNCNHLSKNISHFIKEFPEVKHYVFNNLDPGKADGNIKSRAGDNPWIIARLTDFELELNNTVRILKTNNKTFRIERVPLCYMEGFEEFSTETRKIVKDERYICSFIEKERENSIRIVTPTQLRTKVKICNFCKVNSICGGIQQEYLDLYGEKELFPIFINPDKIIKKILT